MDASLWEQLNSQDHGEISKNNMFERSNCVKIILLRTVQMGCLSYIIRGYLWGVDTNCVKNPCS